MFHFERSTLAWLTAVLGVSISIGLSIFFYIRTDLKPALATFAGLLGLIITLQLEQRLLHTGHKSPTIERVADAQENVFRAASNPFVEDFVRRIVDSCVVKLNSLAAGRVVLSSDDAEWLQTRLIEQTRHTLYATTIGTNDDNELTYWDSPDGHRYLERHAEARHRGVLTKRVFIYDEWTDAFEQQARRHHSVGVTVLRVQKHRLDPAIQMGIVIWDDAHGFELQFNPFGELMHAIYTNAPYEIARLQRSFLRIETAAQPWPPPAG